MTVDLAFEMPERDVGIMTFNRCVDPEYVPVELSPKPTAKR